MKKETIWVFQWPLIGHHICDWEEAQAALKQQQAFQWPLIGHHICDAKDGKPISPRTVVSMASDRPSHLRQGLARLAQQTGGRFNGL